MIPGRPPVDLASERLAAVRGLAAALGLAGAASLTPGAIRARLTEMAPALTGARREAARCLYGACKEPISVDVWGHVRRGFDALEPQP